MRFETNGLKKMVALSIVVLFAFTAFVVVPADNDSSAAESIKVTDGRGVEVTFPAPVNHVVTLGKGVTATVIQLGCLDKIVVCDNYSKGSEPLFDGLKAKIDEGKILADGNCYSSGLAAYKSNVIDAADIDKGGMFDKNNDVLILTAAKTYLDGDTGLVKYFEDLGFKKILVWYNVTTYDDIIDFTTVVSKVITGSVSKDVEQLSYTKQYISNKLKEEGITADKRTNAFYVTVSSGSFKVGNTGSIATSMIQTAGGNAVTVDDKKSGSTYVMSDSELVGLKERYGSGLVVFIDAVLKDTDISKLRTDVGNDVKIVQLESLWNNFSIESMNGLWAMACAMYPTIFTGDVPVVPVDNGNGDVALYLIVGIGAAAVILIAALVYMRRH